MSDQDFCITDSIMMKPKSFAKRTGLPVAIVILVLALTTFLISDGWRFGWVETWDRTYTFLSAVRLFLMFYAVYLIYPFAFFGGASRKERIITSFIPHYVWVLNEFMELVSVYPVGETLFFVLNPGFLFVVVRTFFQIGLCDIICRWLSQKKHNKGYALSNQQTGILLVGCPLLHVIFIVAFLAMIDLYWLIHRGVFQ